MKVFISYTQDSDEHCERVREFSNRLRSNGIDSEIDQYQTSPPEGWPRWMLAQFREAEYVLVVCTETYDRRATGDEARGVGRGARWEASQIFQEIYDADSMNNKFIPVLFSPDDKSFIPEPLRSATWYDVSTEPGYDALYRRLTDQPPVVKPPLGPIKKLSPHRPANLAESPDGFWNVPLRRNDCFVGRDALLARLREHLQPSANAQTPNVLALTGLGGVGKTQACAEFAYRYRNEFAAVIWLRADSEASTYQSVLDAATVLGIQGTATDGPERTAAAFTRWLKEQSGWLLIFDGADHLGRVLPYLPMTGAGSVLIATRAHNVDVVGTRNTIELAEFSPDESLVFLLRQTGRTNLCDTERRAAEEICSELGHLPLALEQAGAFISAKGSSFQGYLASYRSRRLSLLEQAKPSMGGYSASVATTWAINFDEIINESSASADLLRALAFLSPSNVPLEFVVWGANELGEAISSALVDVRENPVALDDLVEPIIRYSLARRDVDNHTLSMHRLVQEVVREGMSPADRRNWMERIVCAVDKCFLMPTEFEHWPFCERLVPHALVAVQYCEEEQLQTESPGHLLNRLGCYLSDHARYSEAKALLERALELRRELLEPNHPYVADTLSNLGLVAERQGNYTLAEGLHREALSIVRGCGNVQESSAENNLAATLLGLGKFEEAEQAFRRSIELKSAAGQSQDTRRASTMVSLALLRKRLGDLTEANVLLREAIEIQEVLLPANHPERARAMGALASVREKDGEAQEAEQLLIECLKIQVAAYGSRHPTVGVTLSELGRVFANQGRFDEAEQAFGHAIGLLEEAIGPRHPDLARVINNLGMLYLERSRYADAEIQLKRCINIFESEVEPPSWDLAGAIGNLAALYEKTGRFGEAVPLAMRALSIDEKCFGQCHQKVLPDMLGVGRLLMCAGRLSEAREYASRAMNAAETAKDDNCDVLLDAMRLLATIDEKFDRIDEATSRYEQCVTIANARIPPGRELVMALYNIGAHMTECGHQERGIAILLRAAEIAASSLGPKSFEEGLVLYGVATVFSKANDPAKAEAYGRQALAILREHATRHPQELISCVSHMAIVCQSRERTAEAESFYRQLIDVWRSYGKPKLLGVVAALNNYGFLESQRGRLPHAKELLDMASETAEEFLGPAEPARAALYNSYGAYYEAMGDVDLASSMYEKALSVWELAGWPNHPHLLIAYKNYANLLQTQKRFGDLELLLPQAIERCHDILGKDSRDEAIFLNDLGTAHGELGNSDEAMHWYTSALAVWEALDWPKDDGVDVVHRNLIAWATMHGDFAIALSAAKSDHAYARKHYGTRHPALVASLNTLGIVCRECRKFDLAERYFEQSLQMIKTTLGSNHPDSPTILSNYARLRRAQDREDAAQRLEEKARRAASWPTNEKRPRKPKRHR